MNIIRNQYSMLLLLEGTLQQYDLSLRHFDEVTVFIPETVKKANMPYDIMIGISIDEYDENTYRCFDAMGEKVPFKEATEGYDTFGVSYTISDVNYFLAVAMAPNSVKS